MYRLIIADDERVVYENILKSMDFESCGFQVTACCENGLDVLEKASFEHPDLIITDIQMPFMDGIELAKKIHELYPLTLVVFLTGFNEFNYAQKAINLKVFDYILKPISANMLTALLLKIKIHLDGRNEELKSLTDLKSYYETSKPLLQNGFLSDLLTFPMSRTQMEYRIDVLGMDYLCRDYFMVSVLSIDRDSLNKDAQTCDLEMYSFAVYNIANELIGETDGVTVIYRGSETVLLLSRTYEDGSAAEEELEKTLLVILGTIRHHMPFTVSVGVSEPCRQLSELAKCYSNAISALDYRITLGGNRILHIWDFEPNQSLFPVFDDDMEKRLRFALKLGTPDELKAAIGEVMDVASRRIYPPAALSSYFMTVFLSLIREAAYCNVDNWEEFASLRMGKLLELSRLDKIDSYLYAFCMELNAGISEKRSANCAVFADLAEQYIQGAYTDPALAIKDICSQMSISPSYLSAIFKKEKGKSIGNYILQLRMEKARTLISATNMKNYEIAEAVGYNDAHYFSYIFKKYFQITPNEMRKALIRQAGECL